MAKKETKKRFQLDVVVGPEGRPQYMNTYVPGYRAVRRGQAEELPPHEEVEVVTVEAVVPDEVEYDERGNPNVLSYRRGERRVYADQAERYEQIRNEMEELL